MARSTSKVIGKSKITTGHAKRGGKKGFILVLLTQGHIEYQVKSILRISKTVHKDKVKLWGQQTTAWQQG